jgi:hypothetical protein
MAQPVTTFGGFAGFAEEVVWGTALPRTNFIEIVSGSVVRAIDRQPEGTLGRPSDLGRVAQRKFTASDNVSGDLVWEPCYANTTALLLKHAMGVVVSSAGPSPFTHTFTLGALPTGLTLEKAWNATQAEVFEGCKISNLTLSVDAGGLMQGTATWIGETSQGIVAASSPTFGAIDEIKHWQASTLSFNGNTYECLKAFTLTLNNGIDVRPALGTTFTKEPAPSQKREVTISIDLEWLATNSLYADYLSGADSDVVITFTGAVSPNAMQITLHNAHISEHNAHPLAGPEVVTDSVTFMGKTDGTDLGLEIVLTNANATAIVN